MTPASTIKQEVSIYLHENLLVPLDGAGLTFEHNVHLAPGVYRAVTKWAMDKLGHDSSNWEAVFDTKDRPLNPVVYRSPYARHNAPQAARLIAALPELETYMDRQHQDSQGASLVDAIARHSKWHVGVNQDILNHWGSAEAYAEHQRKHYARFDSNGKLNKDNAESAIEGRGGQGHYRKANGNYVVYATGEPANELTPVEYREWRRTQDAVQDEFRSLLDKEPGPSVEDGKVVSRERKTQLLIQARGKVAGNVAGVQFSNQHLVADRPTTTTGNRKAKLFDGVLDAAREFALGQINTNDFLTTQSNLEKGIATVVVGNGNIQQASGRAAIQASVRGQKLSGAYGSIEEAKRAFDNGEIGSSQLIAAKKEFEASAPSPQRSTSRSGITFGNARVASTQSANQASFATTNARQRGASPRKKPTGFIRPKSTRQTAASVARRRS